MNYLINIFDIKYAILSLISTLEIVNLALNAPNNLNKLIKPQKNGLADQL